MSSHTEPLQAASTPTPKRALFWQGMMAMMPLSIAVIPWGLLAGSMAMNTGLSVAQAIAMSAVIFAGAAQLVSLGLVMAGASFATIVVTVFFLTAQHFIYALTLRGDIAKHKLLTRVGLGFLLTDELFALAARPEQRQVPYLFGAGLCFYLFWVVASIAGIVLASMVPNLQQYHLDFSIVAIFIPIIVILLKNRAAIAGLVVTTVCVLMMKHLQLEGAMIVSGMAGMLVAALIERQKEAA